MVCNGSAFPSTAECGIAFVGASSLVVDHHSLVQLDTLGTMPSDGRCYSYDARANGFGREVGASCLNPEAAGEGYRGRRPDPRRHQEYGGQSQ